MSGESSIRYSIIPSCAVDDNKLSNGAYRMLGVLGTYSDRQGYCWPSQAALATRLGVSQQAVSKSIRELEHLGYLAITYRQVPDSPAKRATYRLQMDILLPDDRYRSVAPKAPENDSVRTIQPDVVSVDAIQPPGCALYNPQVVQRNNPQVVENVPIDPNKNVPNSFPEKIVAPQSAGQPEAAQASPEQPTDGTATKPKRGRKPKRALTEEEAEAEEKFPVAGWHISHALAQFALDHNPGLDLKRELARFRAYWEEKDKWTTERGWTATWKKWMLSPYQKAMLPPKPPATPAPAAPTSKFVGPDDEIISTAYGVMTRKEYRQTHAAM